MVGERDEEMEALQIDLRDAKAAFRNQIEALIRSNHTKERGPSEATADWWCNNEMDYTHAYTYTYEFMQYYKTQWKLARSNAILLQRAISVLHCKMPNGEAWFVHRLAQVVCFVKIFVYMYA